MFTNLLKWSQMNGAKVNYSLYLFGKTNRTVITNEFIEKDSVIIKYPKNLTIGYRHKKPSYDVVLDTIVSLIMEMKRGWISPYYQYINMLPENLNDLPSVKISPNEFKRLEYSDPCIYHLLKRHYQDSLDIYKDINRLNLDEKYKEFQHTTYLFNLYKTRAWSDYGFVPVLDMINHSGDPNVIIDETSDDNYFIVKALKDIRPCSELTHKYNNLGKKTLYYIYGISED